VTAGDLPHLHAVPADGGPHSAPWDVAEARALFRGPVAPYSELTDSPLALGVSSFIAERSGRSGEIVIRHSSLSRRRQRGVEIIIGRPLIGLSLAVGRVPVLSAALEHGESAYSEQPLEFFENGLHWLPRGAVQQLLRLLGIDRLIVAPVRFGGYTEGVVIAVGRLLREADMAPVARLGVRVAEMLEVSRAVGELRRYQTAARTLSVMSRQVLEGDAPGELPRWAVRALREPLGAAGAAIWLRRDGAADDGLDPGLLHLVAHEGLPSRLLPFVESMAIGSDGFCAAAARDGHTRVVSAHNATGAEAGRDPAVSDETEVAAAIPLCAAGQMLGVLGLSFAAPRGLRPDDLVFVEALATQVSLTLAGSRSLLQAERIKHEILSVTSHELYTPLTPLSGFIQLMTQMIEGATSELPLDQARLRRYLGIVQRRLDHLTRLVHAMLDLTSLQQGMFTLALVEVDIVAVVREVLANFEPITAHPGGIDHTLVLDAPAPVVARCDAQRIDQVLTNLISNAVKYSPGGGTVLVRVYRDGDDAVICVEDDGIGITAAQAERLFRPFVRGSGPEYVGVAGVGLGLYICHEIVSRHGGTITAGPRHQRGLPLGTAVNVRLPLAGPRLSRQSP
jgi:signal transduction histidine kinase